MKKRTLYFLACFFFSLTTDATVATSQSTDLTDPANTLTVHTDLWERLRSGFSLNIPDNKQIAAERRWYLEHPDYIQRVGQRARPFLFHIVEEIESRNLPMEIALLPIVESAFQPFAYSHGSASGIWQFIPATAKLYDLRQDWWYDGRRDVFAATNAALNYLTHLHSLKAINQDWLLALAAYNSGEGKVRNAVRRNKKRHKSTQFWSLKLPRETRGYVPKLLAIVSIIQFPEKYGISLAPIPNRALTTQVNTGGQIDLALAADLAQLPLEKLYQLNAGFNRWATTPEPPHLLTLPLENVASFKVGLASLPPEKKIHWVRHRIRHGETLSHIANRYHTSITFIQKVNKLKHHRIRAGKNLIVPVATKEMSAYALSVDERIKSFLKKPRKGIKLLHTVLPGDTLWDISVAYQVSVKKILSWNGLSPKDYLKPGRTLAIWIKPKQNKNAQVLGLSLKSNKNKSLTTRRIRYIVRGGDSLARISDNFKVSISQLRQWNGLSGEKFIHPGQKLTLYIDVTRQSGQI